MSQSISLNVIAHLHTAFPTKFGIPRQSGLADTHARLVFTPPYRNPDAVRGIEQYSHLWLIWQFSGTAQRPWSPTVRPPKLGGNTRVGVFATRSPFRPNALGLSSVRLEQVQRHTADGPILLVSGADLMDGTPILDIKPYLSYTDAHPDAAIGLGSPPDGRTLEVVCADELRTQLGHEVWRELSAVLACDPRPGYQHDPCRVYGFPFAGFDIGFTVSDGVARVVRVTRL